MTNPRHVLHMMEAIALLVLYHIVYKAMAKKKIYTDYQVSIQIALILALESINDLLENERFDYDVFGKGQDGLYAVLGLENADQLISILIRSGWYELQGENKKYAFKLKPYHERTGHRFPIERKQHAGKKALMMALGKSFIKSKTLPILVNRRKWKGVTATFKAVKEVQTAILASSSNESIPESSDEQEGTSNQQSNERITNRQRARQQTPSSKTPATKVKRRNLQPTPSPSHFSIHTKSSLQRLSQEDSNINARNIFDREMNTPQKPTQFRVSSRRVEFASTPPRRTARSTIAASPMGILQEEGPEYMSPTVSSERRMRMSRHVDVDVSMSSPRLRQTVLSPASTATTATLSSFGDESPFTTSRHTFQNQSMAFAPRTIPNMIMDGAIQLPRAIPVQGSLAKHRPPGFTLSTVQVSGETRKYLVPKGFKAVEHKVTESKHKKASTNVIVIPSQERLVDSSQHTKAMAKAKSFDAINARTPITTRCSFDEKGKLIVAGMTAFNPKLSTLSWEQGIPFAVYALLHGCGLDGVTIDHISGFTPSRTAIENWLVEFAADTILIARMEIEEAGTWYLSFDKADKSKEHSIGGLVKLGSWFNRRATSDEFPDGQINVLPLDADVARGSGEGIAAGVAHSVKKIGITTQAGGKTTDSGGGEKSADAPLKQQGIIRNDGLEGRCTAHAVNLEVSVPILKALTKPDIPAQDSRTVLQLLFSGYYFENEIGKPVMQLYWKATLGYVLEGCHNDDANDPKITELMDEIQVMFSGANASEMSFVALLKGCVTRWSSIGEAAVVLYDTLAMRIVIATKYDDTNESGKAREACRDFLSRASEPILICHLALLKNHHEYYVKPHLTWIQKPDVLTRKAGFQSFNILGRSFLMSEDYAKMHSWQTLEEFRDLRNELDKLSPHDRAQVEKEIKAFFEFGEAEHEKMFFEWESVKHLAFLAAFAEVQTGRLVAQRMLGLPFCSDPRKTEYDNERGIWIDPSSDGDVSMNGANDAGHFIFDSKVHGRKVDLERFAKHVEKKIEVLPEDEWLSHVTNNHALLKKIAGGYDIWDRESVDTFEDRIKTLEAYGAFFSHNQPTERAVKNQNYAGHNNRGEKMVSIRMVVIAFIKEVARFIYPDEKRTPFRGGKKIEENLRLLEEFEDKVKGVKRKLGFEEYKTQKAELVKSLKKTFENVRHEEQLEKYSAALSEEHVPSAKEKRTGVDSSPLIDGKIQIGKLQQKGTNNLQILQQEWAGRLGAKQRRDLNAAEMQAISKTNITAIKTLISLDEKERDPDNFVDNFFKPRYTEYDSYKWDIVKKRTK